MGELRSQRAKRVLPVALFLARFTRKLWQSSFQLLIRTLPTFSAAQCIQPNLTKRYNTQYPIICPITAAYITNLYSQEISLLISGGEETTSAEGTTQGGPNSASI